MTNRRARLVVAAAGVALAVLGGAVASTYIPRLSDHAGHHLVEVRDDAPPAPAGRPRRTVVVVVDGLRADAARGMASTARLASEGWCETTDVGVPSVSRPVYAVLSTGLEQDRTGARNNHTSDEMAAGSIWEEARRAGLVVEGRSELPWWRELFPAGFDRYVVVPADGRVLPGPPSSPTLPPPTLPTTMPSMTTTAPTTTTTPPPTTTGDAPNRAPPAPTADGVTADLALLHPVYVDETAHAHGALGPEHRAAVARVDRELQDTLAGLDLRQDAILVTADHGHRDLGGHGGPEPVVTEVLTCAAGRGVARRGSTTTGPAPPASGADPARLPSTTIAPFLAVLLGAPFPSHMRASVEAEDHLERTFALVDGAALGEPYLAARQAGIEKIRAANRRALDALDAPGWDALRDRTNARRSLALAALTLLGAGAALVALHRRRPRPGHGVARTLLAAALAVAAFVVVYAAMAGGFGPSSINGRPFFLRNAFSASAAALLVGAALARRLPGGEPGDAARLLAALAATTAIGLAAHVVAWGWPLGYPTPPPLLYFAPFPASIFLVAAGVALAATAFAPGRRR